MRIFCSIFVRANITLNWTPFCTNRSSPRTRSSASTPDTSLKFPRRSVDGNRRTSSRFRCKMLRIEFLSGTEGDFCGIDKRDLVSDRNIVARNPRNGKAQLIAIASETPTKRRCLVFVGTVSLAQNTNLVSCCLCIYANLHSLARSLSCLVRSSLV